MGALMRKSALLTLCTMLLLAPTAAFAGNRDSTAKDLEKASRPPGTRQIEWKGKLWPPDPRPTGKPQTYIHRYHFAHYWPHPFDCEDKASVRAISNRQLTNGWVEATTLFDYHFDDDAELNHSGRLQLRWILENAPAQYRYAFVQAAENTTMSQRRMDSVQKQAAEIVGDAQVPSIMLRVTSPFGRSAEEIVNIRKAELQTQPEPRVPFRSLSGMGGGSSSGGETGGE